MAWTAGHQAAADTVYDRITHGQCTDVTAELDALTEAADHLAGLQDGDQQ